jgi:hypothetical protein
VRIGRRPLFFAAVCLVCLALGPVTPDEFRSVNLAMAALALFWAAALAAEDLANARASRRKR